MKNALIAGGTGLIGTRLSQLLTERGYGVAHLSRKSSPKATFPTFSWDPSRRQIDPEALQNVSVLINLAGAGIADGRWTDRRKELIIRSRVESTLFLKETIEGSAGQIDTYLCTSAIGYYGNRGDEWLTEDSKPGKGFLPQSTQQWEKAIDEVRTTGVRTVAFRTGIVLSTHGGALEKILLPARAGAGTYFGDGRQWYSWIHIDDLCRLFIYAMEQEALAGTYNAVAPQPVTNRGLMEALQEVSGRWMALFPIPAFSLRLIFGEMADTILDSTRVAAGKVQKAGFPFQYPEVKGALADLLERKA